MKNKTIRTSSMVGAAMLLLCHNFSYGADTSAQKRYAVPGGGFLQMSVPAGWTEKIVQPSKDAAPMISFGARSGKPFIVNVTPMAQSREVAAPTPENLRKRVEATLSGVQAFAVEKDIKVNEIAGTPGNGYFFRATDAAPKPGEYKFINQGAMKVGTLTVTFTILTSDSQDNVVRDAMTMLGSAAQLPK